MKQELMHKFVEFMPEPLEEGSLYISVDYATAAHKCCCGCGEEVVTPLSPTDWKLIFDGETVSLSPSIGNWSFPCRSHYWIKENVIQWSGDMTKEQVKNVRTRDRLAKEKQYGRRLQPEEISVAQSKDKIPSTGETSLLGQFIKMIKSLWK